MAEAGIYGRLTTQQLELATFAFVAAQKLINTVSLLGATFLSLWVRGHEFCEHSKKNHDFSSQIASS